MFIIQRGPTLLLKALISFGGFFVILFSILALPIFLHSENTEFVPIFITMYISVIPFLFAVYQTIKLLNYVDKNKAFSNDSVNALKHIKYCSIAIDTYCAMRRLQ